MLKAASETRQRCYDHPHRRAVRQCARCKRGFCDDCARERGGSSLCEPCEAELAELARIKHVPPRERVRRFGVSLRNLMIGLAVLGLLAIPGSFVVRRLMEQPISPEEFARFRYAASGTFETPEGVNALSTVLGARVVSATGGAPEHEARRLIDEFHHSAGFPGWQSEEANFPQEVVFETGQSARIEKLFFVQNPHEPPETAVKDVEVLVSSTSAEGPWQSVGRFTLEQSEEPQRFLIEPTNARWIKLRVLSNYGGPYASLFEFNAYALPKNPFAPPTEVAKPASKG